MATYYEPLNLAMTVHAVGRRRLRCTVWRPKKYPPAFVLAGEPHEREDAMTNYHEWQDGFCIHCHKTVEEVLEPKSNKLKKRPKERW
ncbi:MAG: hypothetical protein NUV85_01600 [Candidatus Berkelbacteria bacterium]|nr:hypothetical protein [Candidatus Berkelbacteria bacterium]